MRLNKKKGIVVWITGISGSGKTTISRLIHKDFEKRYGKTMIFQGDELRKILQLSSYSREGRINNGLIYSELLRNITNQKINVIISLIGLFKKIRKRNRKIIENYIEVFIKTSISKVIKNSRKKHYKNKKNIVGIDIKPEFPENPDIKINNNFNKKPKELSKELLKKIFLLIK